MPVFLMVGCNVIDYITGLLAVPYRTETVSSYKGIRGIIKKVCQWLLVLVGAWIDILLNYAIDCAGIDFTLPFVVATIVAVWLVVMRSSASWRTCWILVYICRHSYSLL